MIRGILIKRLLLILITPLVRIWLLVVTRGWRRIWSLASLRAQTNHKVDASNVIHGPIEIHGTGNIRIGHNALIYPDCYMETQGCGEIILGDDIVLSRGVHIVAFEQVTIGAGSIIGEYSSVRDANHKLSRTNIRNSGHEAARINVGKNVWLARGVTVLKGVTIGDNAVVAAGAVVNRSVLRDEIVGGLPARSLKVNTHKSAALTNAILPFTTTD